MALGCDPAGMLGGIDPGVFAAAAALPNQTTAGAEIVLPLPMTCELAGTIQAAGGAGTAFAAALAPPAGVMTACKLIEGDAGTTAALRGAGDSRGVVAGWTGTGSAGATPEDSAGSSVTGA